MLVFRFDLHAFRLLQLRNSFHDMVVRTAKLLTKLAIVIVMINIVLAIVSNVPTFLSDSDRLVFRSALHLSEPDEPLTFDQEIAAIRDVQAKVVGEAPLGEPIPDYRSREPADLIQNRSGLCYDISRTIDKALHYEGFQTRHVYILYPEDPATGETLSYLKAFFTRGTASHAVTEVKTKRGWLVVDSNSPWISLTRDGDAVDADHVDARSKDFDSIPSYFDRPFLAIRGLYSRRGQLYRPYIPYPQLNWVDFMNWLASKVVI